MATVFSVSFSFSFSSFLAQHFMIPSFVYDEFLCHLLYLTFITYYQKKEPSQRIRMSILRPKHDKWSKKKSIPILWMQGGWHRGIKFTQNTLIHCHSNHSQSVIHAQNHTHVALLFHYINGWARETTVHNVN